MTAGERNIISGNQSALQINGVGMSDNIFIGNYIGTDVTGTQAIGNGTTVDLSGGTQHNFIGGTTDGERNIISGNTVGVKISQAGTGYNWVVGNYIGTDASGTTALGNNSQGVSLEDFALHNVLQSNLISGNGESGVGIRYGSNSNLLRANRIGVAGDGISPLPNGEAGVRIEGTSNTVGGPYPDDGNTIAFNNGDGVQVWTYPANTIRRNSIYGNSASGIHLGDGGNDLLAAPIITGVLTGSVSGTACLGCIVELFSDEDDEGRVYEGNAIVDGNGNWTWTGSLNGPYVTATATDEAGNTSPFSAPQIAWRHGIYLPLILREKD